MCNDYCSHFIILGVQAPRFKATSVNSSELSSTSSGPCFKILEVKPNPTFTNSQQSNPQARANDSVDGQSNTTTKFPQQVADANQGSWGYMDLPKIQLQYCRPTRTADPNGGDSLIKQVEAGQFPKYELLHKKPGHILYSIEVLTVIVTYTCVFNGFIYITMYMRSIILLLDHTCMHVGRGRPGCWEGLPTLQAAGTTQLRNIGKRRQWKSCFFHIQ